MTQTHTANSAARRLKDPFSPAVQKVFINTDWPIIGGRGVDLVRPTGWEEPDVAKHFLEGARIKVGILAGDGLHKLAQALHTPIYKITTTSDETEDLATRRSHLGRARYGSFWRDNGVWQQDPGFDRWEIKYLATDVPMIAGSPVNMTDRSFVVHLPAILTPRDFDARLRGRLMECSLHAWVQTPVGQHHCNQRGVDPSQFIRFTNYDCGQSAIRPTAAHELVIIKPTTFAERLVAIIEQIVWDAVVKTNTGQCRPRR